MGKHSAPDGATVHPLVADALERRQLGAAPVATAGPSTVGWPGDPGPGEGLGWPGDALAAPVDRHHNDDGSLLAALDEAAALELTPVQPAPEQGARRTGWRRFFGGGPAAPRDDTTAA